MPVSISDEKPVPSLLCCFLDGEIVHFGFNLRREASSLATTSPTHLPKSFGVFQSQTRSQFPRYATTPAADEQPQGFQSQTRSQFPRYRFQRGGRLWHLLCFNLRREASSLATAQIARPQQWEIRVSISDERVGTINTSKSGRSRETDTA